MPLAPGQKLSFYTLLAPLGAGGMGEVWRALDTRLGREVAIKVLPESFAGDEERLRRFEREARALAALSHPNVAQIHGIDQVGDTCFLALELVEGEDLAQRLARGPLPVEEALDVCRQIAEGLGAAHDAGVVHRDLKPANVRRTPEGVVKVLDFGLARQAGGRAGEGTPTPKPDSFFATEAGLVLGTPTYMSPEQARGKLVDRRTDVWAFGCVLYECLTGKRAFEGAALADVLAAIVQSEPDWTLLPAGTPPRVRELLRRTLEKDPRQRLQHLGDARVELERALAEPPGSARGIEGARPARGPWLVGGLALAAGIVLGALLVPRLGLAPARPVEPSAHLARVSVPILACRNGIHPRLAPDGRALVFAAEEPDGRGGERTALFLRRLDTAEPVRLPGTEHLSTLSFSPDGTALAVVAREGERGPLRLLEVRLDEGTPRSLPLGSLGPDPNPSSGLAWTDAGQLVMGALNQRLLVRPVRGGSWQSVPIQGGDQLVGEVEVYRALPGGRHVLAHSFVYGDEGFEPSLLALDVASGAAVRVATGGFGAWSGRDQLLFTRGSALFALDFEPATLTARGVPRLLLDGLRTRQPWQPGWFDLARDGTLLHEPGGPQGRERRLVTITPQGEVQPWSAEGRAYDGLLALSQDGGFFAAAMVAPDGLLELWGSELAAPLLRPLIAEPRTDFLPGPIDVARKWLYFSRFSKDERDGIWRARLDSPREQEPVWCPDGGLEPFVVGLSPDGSTLLVFFEDGARGQLGEIRIDGEVRGEPRTLLEFPDQAGFVLPSPDGRWLAHGTSAEGQSTVLLRRRREDGSFGPAIPLPRESAGDALGVAWVRRAAEERPALLVSPDGQRILELEILADDPPRLSAPRLVAALERPLLLTLRSLPDGRLLALLRGESELSFERVELVLGFDGLLDQTAR